MSCELSNIVLKDKKGNTKTYSGIKKVLLRSDGDVLVPYIKEPQTKDLIVVSKKEQQIIEPEIGSFFKKITVNPIPSEYTIPSGNIEIKENGYFNVKDFETATVSISDVGYGIIDVTELPTTGLIEDAVYRLTEKEPEVYCKRDGIVYSFGDYIAAVAGAYIPIRYIVVSELPSPTPDMSFDPVDVYILEETGESFHVETTGYIRVADSVSYGNSVDKGWVSDISELPELGTGSVLENKVSLYIVADGELHQLDKTVPIIEYVLSDDGTYYSAKGNIRSKESVATILGEYNGLPVKAVAEMGFEGVMVGVVKINSGVESIGRSAFSDIRAISALLLPNSLRHIGDNAFVGCTGLYELILPPLVDTVGTGAFYRCAGLLSVTFQGTPAEIASDAFSQCSSLSHIYVPWAEGEVANAPWGARSGVTIHYNYTEE